MTPISLILRLVKGSAITASENDQNLSNLKVACDELNSEKATKESPVFTGIVTIPAGAIIDGYATSVSPTITGTLTADSLVTTDHSSVKEYPPVTITGAYTISDTDRYIICNGSASISLTLPAANTSSGRKLWIKNIKAFTVVSASSNVVPLTSGTAGTAILTATIGKWCEMVSDGTNWIIVGGN